LKTSNLATASNAVDGGAINAFSFEWYGAIYGTVYGAGCQRFVRKGSIYETVYGAGCQRFVRKGNPIRTADELATYYRCKS
jgi:hypothetical protein